MVNFEYMSFNDGLGLLNAFLSAEGKRARGQRARNSWGARTQPENPDRSRGRRRGGREPRNGNS